MSQTEKDETAWDRRCAEGVEVTGTERRKVLAGTRGQGCGQTRVEGTGRRF